MKGDIHSFTVIGKPISKKRPRFVTRQSIKGVFTRNVNVQQTEEGRFLWEVLTQWDQKPILEGALSLKIEFIYERPKSHFGTGRNIGSLKKSAPPLCDKISNDLDNLEKFLQDSLNKFIYQDDRQVVSLSSCKVWGENAKTVFTIEELDDSNI